MNKLQGTEKQIAWAEKIRATEINKVEFALKEMDTRIENATYKEMPTQIKNWLEVLLEEIKNQVEAKYWIENQNIGRHIIEKATRREM